MTNHNKMPDEVWFNMQRWSVEQRYSDQKKYHADHVLQAALAERDALRALCEGMAGACQDILDRNEIQHWFNTDKQREALAAYEKHKQHPTGANEE